MKKSGAGMEEEHMKYPWLDEYLMDKPGAEQDFKAE